MAEFAADITNWVRKTKLSGAVVMRKLGLDAYRGIMLRSPVDTGRFRASHRIGINQVDTTVEPESKTKSKRGIGERLNSDEFRRASSKLSGIGWGVTIHITNSLPYAQKLENGSSAQNSNQPDGIYGATFAELRANLEAAIRAARL